MPSRWSQSIFFTKYSPLSNNIPLQFHYEGQGTGISLGIRDSFYPAWRRKHYRQAVYSVVGRRCQYTEAAFAPLRGYRVLDLSRVLAGPYCTMILGDLGAEIIKVEKPGTGDDTRGWGPPWIKPGHSAYFPAINRNKKSVAVNIKDVKGVDLVKSLASKCDILIENYIPGKLAELGLGYQQMREVNPGLIYTSITGFGQTGPYAERAGYDNIAAAVGGLMHITGPQDGEPCRVGVAMTDLSTGLYAYGAIVSALLHREKTGSGQHIDCNLLNTQVATLTHIASNYLNCGLEAKRFGTGHVSIVPYQVFKTMDGYLMVGAGNDHLYKAMCKCMDLPHLVTDVRFVHNEDRVRNRTDLIDILSQKFSEKSTTDWMSAFEGSGLPFGPINNMEQVFADEQVLHNGMIQEMEDPHLGTIKIPGPAVSYSAGELPVRHCPPSLGQNTEQVLRDVLSLGGAEIDRLREEGVIQ